MFINKKRIHNVVNYLSAIPDGAEFRVIVKVTDDLRGRLQKVGFDSSPKNGDCILPRGIGSISRFNSDGKHIVLKNLPKESRYLYTRLWTWKQWAGGGEVEEHQEFRDVCRDCYQRDYIPPPSVELTFSVHEGKSLIVSPVLINHRDHHEHIKHTINLLLEFFGCCELVQMDLSQFQIMAVKRLNWRLLPPGKYPWDKLQPYLDDLLKRRSPSVSCVISDRQETIKSYSPNEIFVGEGGFNDYLAYVFKHRGFVVLESVNKGNAIYVFDRDWKEFSQMTKAEIISHGHQLKRIVHSDGWKSKLHSLMTRPEAA